MALEKLTIKRICNPLGMERIFVEICIDFAVGESSLSGDEGFIEMLKLQILRMPKSPCNRALGTDIPVVAHWGAQPFDDKHDFKVLLFALDRYIEGDRYFDFVNLNNTLNERYIFSDYSIRPLHDNNGSMVVAEERAEYYTRMSEHYAIQAKYYAKLSETLMNKAGQVAG